MLGVTASVIRCRWTASAPAGAVLPASFAARGTAGEHSRAVANLAPVDRAIFEKSREQVSTQVDDAAVAHAMLSAKREGIRDASLIERMRWWATNCG